MAEFQDYYKILGMNRKATAKEIRVPTASWLRNGTGSAAPEKKEEAEKRSSALTKPTKC